MHDRFDNALTEGGTPVGGSLVLTETGETVAVEVTDQGDGSYACSYIATRAGTYMLTPSVLDEPIKGAPFTVTIAAGTFHFCFLISAYVSDEASPEHFIWHGPDQEMLVAGTTGQFSIVAHDCHGNRLPSGGLALAGSLTGGADVPVEVADGGDGSYTFSYTPTRADTYTLSVTLQSALIGGHENPFTFRCTPAEAHGPSSHAAGTGLTHAVAGETSTFMLGTRDRFGNECVEGGANVAAALTHTGTGECATLMVKDERDGTYEVRRAYVFSLIPLTHIARVHADHGGHVHTHAHRGQ